MVDSLDSHISFIYLLGVIDRERRIFISCLIRLTVVAMTTGILNFDQIPFTRSRGKCSVIATQAGRVII